MSNAPRLLRDVINIPTETHKGDLVFKLADAADHAAQTVDEYVVTDQLLQAFLDAAGLIRSAVTGNASKAAFLHGSFGSGKSNFMGILQLLLDDYTGARSKPELAPVVASLDEWKGDKKFLTVPFHLIGADDLESAIFGQYVRHLKEIEPSAPPPAVFADEPILENADQLRSKVGDDMFFADLSSGSTGGSGEWGAFETAWTASSYDAARNAPHGAPDRTRLVQALLGTWLPTYAAGAAANRAGYVSFEDGLSAISIHAQSLGYSGVILFLDELILWFISRMADMAWVNEEASKLSELVEAASAGRPVPIVSIIARQRDLRDLVGDGVPGVERVSFADQLKFQADRFSTITLDDSNLPLVANRRLLTPISPEARAELDAAFETMSLSPRVHDALLAEQGTDEVFRLTYPFSPAFMTVLVGLAEALQRTRTGLRVLLELLVARRDYIEVGQLVPVGDLYDVLDSGNDALSDVMRSAFEQARKIYRERLRPALLGEHQLGPADPLTTAFVNDDRLIKTLLLAALVPESPPFKNLTVERLVALNHGTITSPIPGQETAIAINKLNHLAAHVGELSIGSDANNPTVFISLAGVDTTAILGSADTVDNSAARRTLVRELVMNMLGLSPGELQSTYPFVWNGLRRDVAVVFGNIRDASNLPDAAFSNDGPSWKLIVDFPFDEGPFTPRDDLARLEGFRTAGASWSTLCWLPSFFTQATQDILGRLVRLNYVLASDQRFNDATKQLSQVDRASAKPILESMRTATRSQIDAALLGAYGVVTADEKVVDVGHPLESHFPSLKLGLVIAPPTKANFQEALNQVLDQALKHTYPGSPDLGTEVKVAEVRRVAALCTDAVVEPDGRLVVSDSGDRRLLQRIANPLQLGIQSEQAFTLAGAADRWDNAFNKAISQARINGAEAETVGLLRQAIDTPLAMGLTTQLENLIILVWAKGTNRTFRLHGGPVEASVDRLDDVWEVVPQDLPSQEAWSAALERLSSIFGINLPTKQLSGYSVERAGIELRKVSAEHRAASDALLATVTRVGDEFGLSGDSFARLESARAAQKLLSDLDNATTDLERVEVLAEAPVGTSELGLGKSISTAQSVVAELQAAQFPIIRAAMAQPEGQSLGSRLSDALATEELAIGLVAVLREVQAAAIGIVTTPTAPVTPLPNPTPPPPPSYREWKGNDVLEARTQLDDIRDRIEAGSLSQESVQIAISWNEPESAGPTE